MTSAAGGSLLRNLERTETPDSSNWKGSAEKTKKDHVRSPTLQPLGEHNNGFPLLLHISKRLLREAK